MKFDIRFTLGLIKTFPVLKKLIQHCRLVPAHYCNLFIQCSVVAGRFWWRAVLQTGISRGISKLVSSLSLAFSLGVSVKLLQGVKICKPDPSQIFSKMNQWCVGIKIFNSSHLCVFSSAFLWLSYSLWDRLRGNDVE